MSLPALWNKRENETNLKQARERAEGRWVCSLRKNAQAGNDTLEEVPRAKVKTYERIKNVAVGDKEREELDTRRLNRCQQAKPLEGHTRDLGSSRRLWGGTWTRSRKESSLRQRMENSPSSL